VKVDRSKQLQTILLGHKSW